MARPPDDPFTPTSSRRLLVVPAVLVALLAITPWVMEYLEDHWLPVDLKHLRELVDCAITVLLGWWILYQVRREQQITRNHLRELEHLSLTDPLTGLGNRRAFERDLEIAVRRAQRAASPLALLYLDVDGLKRLNDRFGHAIGDETLRALAAVLRSSSRLGIDSAYRVGGDEFVMVLEADGKGAESISERLAQAFEERSPRHSHVSSGVVIWDGETRVQQLIDEADSRMYRSKRPRLRMG